MHTNVPDLTRWEREKQREAEALRMEGFANQAKVIGYVVCVVPDIDKPLQHNYVYKVKDAQAHGDSVTVGVYGSQGVIVAADHHFKLPDDDRPIKIYQNYGRPMSLDDFYGGIDGDYTPGPLTDFYEKVPTFPGSSKHVNRSIIKDDPSQVLIKEAKKRGFVKGVRVIHLTDDTVRDITHDSGDAYQVYQNGGAFSVYVGVSGERIRIYKNGKWSKILSMGKTADWCKEVKTGDILKCVTNPRGSVDKGDGWRNDLEFEVTKIKEFKTVDNSQTHYVFFGAGQGCGVYHDFLEPIDLSIWKVKPRKVKSPKVDKGILEITPKRKSKKLRATAPENNPILEIKPKSKKLNY